MSFRQLENAFLAMDALDANWNESQHPRKGGKFTSKGGGGSKGGKLRRTAENMNIAFNPFAQVPMEEVQQSGVGSPKGKPHSPAYYRAMNESKLSKPPSASTPSKRKSEYGQRRGADLMDPFAWAKWGKWALGKGHKPYCSFQAVKR